MAAERPYKSTPHTRKGATTTFGSRTDIGCLRDHNEDSLVVAPPLFAVADGMGGHNAGEVASAMAVRVLEEEMRAPISPTEEALRRALHLGRRLQGRLMEAGERRSGEMTFYVVRHGQTLFNVMGKVQGWCDTPLTDEGVRAAEALGRGLAGVDFTAAFSSDSGRAV